MRKTVLTKPTPAELMAAIRATAEPLMEGYQTDLGHDESWINQHPGRAFVHVTREMGTELFELPRAEPLIANKPERWMFGYLPPSEIYIQCSGVLKNYMRSVARHAFVFDGYALRSMSIDEATADYDEALASALREAKQARQAARAA